MISVWAASIEEKSVFSPPGAKKQSTTFLRPCAGRLIGRHSLPNTSRIDASTASRFASGASMRFTMIMRHRPRRLAASIMRCVTISTPATALTTTATVVDGGQHGKRAAEQVRVTGRVDERDVLCAELEPAHGRLEAVLQFLFLRVEITHRRAALERAHDREGAGRVQQRLGQQRLPGAGMADEREGVDVSESVLRHG